MWTNGTSLQQVYQADLDEFTEQAWKNAVAARTNLVILGRTVDGVIVGGFTGSALLPS